MKRIIKIGVFIFLVAGIILYFNLTRKEPETDRIAQEQHDSLAAHSLEIAPARAEYKLAYESWVKSGFIVKFDRFSHQVWLDTSEWRSLPLEEKKYRIKVISEMASETDGTFQLVASDPVDDTFLADYFAGDMRLNKDYLK